MVTQLVRVVTGKARILFEVFLPMKTAFFAVLAAAALAGTASAQQFQTLESFKGTVAGAQNTTGNNPGTIPGTPDLDAAGTVNSTYAYAPFIQSIDDEANDFPLDLQTADGKYLSFTGATDHFLRFFATADVPNTSPAVNVAFAFRFASISANPGENDLDLWRLLDVAATGGAATICAFTVRDGVIAAQSNGLVAASSVLGNTSTLTANRWYIIAARYNRAAAGAGTFDASLIDTTNGAVVGTNSQTGLTAANLNGLRVLATGATFAAPTGNAACVINLDDFAVYSNALTFTALVLAARQDFTGAPANVQEWSMY